MAQFKYEGRDKTGKKRKGKISGLSRREIMLNLREKGIAVSHLYEEKESILHKEITIGNPVKFKDFVIYLRQFATLIQAGVSIVESTKVLAAQTDSKPLRMVLLAIEEDLRTGKLFSEAAAKHKKVFPSLFFNLIQAAEVSGTMDETLEQLADYFEKQHQTRQKVKSAMAYPVVVGLIAFGVVIFLLTSVVPTFANMFNDFGAELPAITVFVLGISGWMQSYWWTLVLLILLLLGIFTLLRKNSSSKYFIDYAILKIPFFGILLQKAALARITRTLSSLFSSSVPILKAMSIVENIAENEVIALVLRDARASLEKGQALSEPMRKHWVFPPLVTQMISIGEQTGSLDLMLSKVADFYEKEVENTTDQLKSLIEPIMIVFLAIIVGTIVLSIMVPMFEVFNHVG